MNGKLSFSLSSKPSSKRPAVGPATRLGLRSPPPPPTTKEYVSEFDPSKTLATSEPKKLVIPPKPNEWRPHKKLKNLDLPITESNGPDPLQFEVVPASGVPDAADSNISYGLNLRQSSGKIDADFGNSQPTREPLSDSRVTESIDSLMVKQLKDDLDRLPEDLGFAEFEDMPVEGFGKALLSGYGWYEGRGIGRNAKEDVKVKSYERKAGREGLGFSFSSDDVPKSNKDEESGRAKGKSEKVKNVDKDIIFVGKEVRIVGGKEMGLKGKIVELVKGHDSVVLRLSRSEEEVIVRDCDIADLGSVEEEKCLKKLKDLKIREFREDKVSNGDRESSRKKDSKRNREGEDRRKAERKGAVHKGDYSRRVSWLASHIRVRIVSKKLGHRLYLKKGEVVDVSGPTTCDISMDENGEVIQGVDQELLETALPKRGGPVLVLYGRYKGVYGSLVERDTENETGVVQDADTHELLNVQLEQIAEYIGDPSYIGY